MIEHEPFRLPPVAAPEFYKTYEIIRPRSTHTRVATCAEVDCVHHARGWVTKIDVSTDLGKRQARYIRNHSGRRFVEATTMGDGPIITLNFHPGQTCFTEHRVPIDRPPIYRVRGGDFRGNPRGVATVTRPATDWVDDFANHQSKIKEAHERG